MFVCKKLLKNYFNTETQRLKDTEKKQEKTTENTEFTEESHRIYSPGFNKKEPMH